MRVQVITDGKVLAHNAHNAGGDVRETVVFGTDYGKLEVDCPHNVNFVGQRVALEINIDFVNVAADPRPPRPGAPLLAAMRRTPASLREGDIGVLNAG